MIVMLTGSTLLVQTEKEIAMGQVRTKSPMSMKEFWRELAGLLDKGWVAIACREGAGKFDSIRLDWLGKGVIKLNPVMALACEKNRGRIPVDLEESCQILNLSFQAGLRVKNASISHGRHIRIRWQLLRTLGLKPPIA